MGGRGRLTAGQPRALGRHDGLEGAVFRRAWASLVGEFGQPEPRSLLRLEMARAAVACVNFEVATRALVDARRAREKGRGRRPSPRAIERLCRRQGLADGSYSQALDKLRELVAGRNAQPASISDLVARQRQSGASA
jgi:hypothetical protein